MYIGVGYVRIKIYDAYSRKDRRQIVTSIVARLRQKYNISISVLDKGDVWNIAEFGIAAVSSSKPVIDGQMDKIETYFLEDFRYEVLAFEYEID